MSKVIVILLIGFYIVGFTKMNPLGAFGPVLQVALTHTHEQSHSQKSDHDFHQHQDEDSPQSGESQGDSHGEEAPHAHETLLSGHLWSTPTEGFSFGNLVKLQLLDFDIRDDQAPKAPALSGLLRPPI